jgi:Protein of unknown function (DUF998)
VADEHTPTRSSGATGLSLAAIVLVAVACVAVIALHLLRTDLNPVREVMSGYANGSYGLLMTIAFYALGVASIAVGIRLIWATERFWASRLVSALLILAGCGLILAGIFEVERPGVPDTIQEKIHSDGAIAGFILIIAAMVLFTYVCHRDARWRSFFPIALPLAVGAVIAAAFSPIAPSTSIAGIAQRVLALIVFGWMVTVAVRVRFHAEAVASGDDAPGP